MKIVDNHNPLANILYLPLKGIHVNYAPIPTIFFLPSSEHLRIIDQISCLQFTCCRCFVIFVAFHTIFPPTLLLSDASRFCISQTVPDTSFLPFG